LPEPQRQLTTTFEKIAQLWKVGATRIAGRRWSVTSGFGAAMDLRENLRKEYAGLIDPSLKQIGRVRELQRELRGERFDDRMHRATVRDGCDIGRGGKLVLQRDARACDNDAPTVVMLFSEPLPMCRGGTWVTAGEKRYR
jgi:hypothetical protein